MLRPQNQDFVRNRQEERDRNTNGCNQQRPFDRQVSRDNRRYNQEANHYQR